jgi:histidine ammonia-lyase
MADTLNNILATELLAAIEGCDHQGLELTEPLREIKALVRAEVPRMDQDRWFGPAYEAARLLVKTGEISAHCADI